MELNIIKGRGYYPAEENKTEDAPFGTIFIDSIFTPIKNVQYAVENYRVEQKTDSFNASLGWTEVRQEVEEFDESSLHMRQLLKTKLVDMDLSVRALNCLKAAEVETLGELVNGEVVNIPSYQLRPGDTVGVREKSKSLETIVLSLNAAPNRFDWLDWDNATFTGKLINLPARELIPENIREQLIVELYSK